MFSPGLLPRTLFLLTGRVTSTTAHSRTEYNDLTQPVVHHLQTMSKTMVAINLTFQASGLAARSSGLFY
jgi:hypothetical protein